MRRYYLLQVLCHKWFILVAGIRMGKIPIWRLLIHDWTKFLPVEYRVYRLRFTGKPCDEADWKKAVLHHKKSNPHHPEYWISNGVPLPMPDSYIREMVIDWMAAGKGYHGSWNIQEWIDRKHRKIILHPDTLEKLKVILLSQGFKWPEE